MNAVREALAAVLAGETQVPAVYYATGDGRITVEVVDLICTPEPSRPGDPPGDGVWLLVRSYGSMLGYTDMAGLGAYADLADLHKVDHIQLSRENGERE